MSYAPEHALRFGPLGPRCVHLCIDMQRLFAEATAWHTPGLRRVLPNVDRIAAAHAAETIFMRFVTPHAAADVPGVWRRYYEHWHSVTLGAMAPAMLDLMPPLDRHVPPARMLDKRTYSPWVDDGLADELRRRGTDTIVVTGCETDVCVLGAVLGAVDRGFRTIVVADALCSASEAMHEATMLLFRSRFSLQVEAVDTDTLLAVWAC